MTFSGAVVNQFSQRARVGLRGSMMRSLSDLRATPPTEADTAETSEEKLRRLFEEWKDEYGKKYKSAAEEEASFRAFKETVREAEAHNAKVDKGEESEYRLHYSGPYADYATEELAEFVRTRFGSELETLRHPYRVKRPLHKYCRW